MDTLIRIEISFMASVFDLRNRACRELHCDTGSQHYKLLKYNRVLQKVRDGDDQELCGSARDQSRKGKQTLW